jgi:hypothetical protein
VDEVENVDVVRDQDYQLPNEEIKAEMNEEMNAENEKISKPRKVFEINKDHESIISIISKGFNIMVSLKNSCQRNWNLYGTGTKIGKVAE